mgnify:CR=1 FL=1
MTIFFVDIEYLSEFPCEKEVLIMDNAKFKVMKITTKSDSDIEIELRDSKSTRSTYQKDKKSGLLGLFTSK